MAGTWHLSASWGRDEAPPQKAFTPHQRITKIAPLHICFTPQGSPHLQTQVRLTFFVPFLLFLFYLLPFPVHSNGFSFCFFPGFLAIIILLSSQQQQKNTSTYCTALTKEISISFPIEWNLIVVTVFHLIMNQTELHMDQNQKENCQYHHIPFILKGLKKIDL